MGKGKTVINVVREYGMRMPYFNWYGSGLFSGNDEKSGFANGRISFETYLDLETCHEDEFYKPGNVWRPGGGHTGLSSTQLADSYHRYEFAGRAKAEVDYQDESSNWLEDWMTSTAGQIAILYGGAIALAIILLLLDINNTVAYDFLRNNF